MVHFDWSWKLKQKQNWKLENWKGAIQRISDFLDHFMTYLPTHIWFYPYVMTVKHVDIRFLKTYQPTQKLDILYGSPQTGKNITFCRVIYDDKDFSMIMHFLEPVTWYNTKVWCQTLDIALYRGSCKDRW